MATKNLKNRKPLSAAAKGYICLAVLVALTVFVSCLSLAGMKLDAEGVQVLLPWVPVVGAQWPDSLPVSRTLGGGSFVEYVYTLPEDADAGALDASLATIRTRLSQMGENDAAVSVKDDTVRIELRKMDASRLSSLREMGTMGGQFEFTDSEGTVILTEKDVSKAEVSVKYNNARTAVSSISVIFRVSAEGLEKLSQVESSYLAVTCDGDTVSSYGFIDEGTITCSMGTSNSAYNTAANVAFLMNTGAVDVTLTLANAGETAASAGGVLSIVTIVFALLLVCALVYLAVTAKLTGVAAFASVWCAVMLNFFFVAAIVVPSSIMLNVGCVVSLLLGVLLAVYAAVTRADAVGKQITEGSAPKAAAKQGLRAVAPTVWIVHGAVLALSLILMIFHFSQSVGYVLASGVVASAMATIVMRAFQFCFTMISNKPDLFGKVK